MNQDFVVIGIPIYKDSLNEYENISLQQLNRVLWRYPKMFIAPSSLSFDYGVEYSDWEIERFPDKYFKNTDSYSELLMSDLFYQRLYNYDFLLIYQLDAFVFSDELERICLKGYDYIGAPLPSMVPDWGKLKISVGNGGLSLRNIEKSLMCVKNKKYICMENEFSNRLLRAEDLFFSYCGVNPNVDFRVPDRREAEEFAVDFNVRGSYLRLAHQLPFGCHGWYLRSYDIWKPIIERFGYDLSHLKNVNHKNTSIKIRNQFIRRYLSIRILRAADETRLKRVVLNILPRKQQYAIWGFGDDGKRCKDLLSLAGIDITVVYDFSFSEIKRKAGILYKQPNIAEMKNKISLIVSTSAYEDSIAMELNKNEMIKNIDYFLFSDIESDIVRKYYGIQEE